MVKKVKGNADSEWSQSVRESAHVIWLAGLGAFAKVSSEGGKTRGRMIETWDKLEQIFEDRLNRVLGRLGVPSSDDLRELTQRIDTLQARLDELGRARDNPQG
ncbi:MAG: poly(hydroxyalkanoate) granule-associated protein [Proteobacteria bacterium]|nr:poly(hydroxyalkanoate) granule-associated protein [Pseudomonadota bacterium]